MLTFSRIGGTQHTEVALADLADAALRLAASDYDLKKRYDFRNIAIEREFDPDLPAVPCDPTAIEQVLLNLFKNAAQAMAADGTVGPRILVTISILGLHACLTVEDNGPGMGPATERRVFEPFFTTKAVGIGTGLGLSVSYFIITEQHRGSLTVTSRPGEGSCFTVKLPVGGGE